MSSCFANKLIVSIKSVSQILNSDQFEPFLVSVDAINSTFVNLLIISNPREVVASLPNRIFLFAGRTIPAVTPACTL